MIKRDQAFGVLSYGAVGIVSILLAFWLSTALLGPSLSQESNGELSVEDTPGDGELADDPAMFIESESAGGNNGDQTNVQVEVQSFLEPFIYDPKGRRDPFKRYSDAPVAEEGVPVGPLMPLQRFDLADLRLVGIIWDVREPKAMFLDPSSRIYTLGKDERIGRNNGYIAAIREGEVVVIEAAKQRDGETLYTPRVIRMER